MGLVRDKDVRALFCSVNPLKRERYATRLQKHQSDKSYKKFDTST